MIFKFSKRFIYKNVLAWISEADWKRKLQQKSISSHLLNVQQIQKIKEACFYVVQNVVIIS